ncbi:MAG: hypothetical protein JKY56_18215 [Kofleriaceae bacterium]|nr:hypothetical protein [Kofleriaceae bacterium]
MAKKQTRRSISVSRGTYERLKAYCETNQISMSQFVERRVGDFLGRSGATAPEQATSAPAAYKAPAAPASVPVIGTEAKSVVQSAVQSDAFSIPAVEASVAEAQTTARPASRLSTMSQPLSQAVAAPRPVVQPASDEPLAKDPDAKLTADQIFTF